MRRVLGVLQLLMTQTPSSQGVPSTGGPFLKLTGRGLPDGGQAWHPQGQSSLGWKVTLGPSEDPGVGPP